MLPETVDYRARANEFASQAKELDPRSPLPYAILAEGEIRSADPSRPGATTPRARQILREGLRHSPLDPTLLWMLASLYFRAEVRGLRNIPKEGPVLLVGNHSGGNLTPDTGVFTLAFNTYFGVERRFFQLAHNLVLSMPGLGFLRKYGTVAASHENAHKALRSGAALLVYPGGDYEVHRPSWEAGRGGVMPFRVTRRAYVAICIVGIVAGLAVFAIGWSARSA